MLTANVLAPGSAVHQAYLPIVAASTRAATLHYCCNDKDFAWGPVLNGHGHMADLAHDGARNLAPQVLLIDAGAEFNNYASDSEHYLSPWLLPFFYKKIGVTRTMPVGNGGKFTPEARAIYSLVLEMQNVRPSSLSQSLSAFSHLPPGINQDPQAVIALGQSPFNLSPYLNQRLSCPWHLQRLRTGYSCIRSVSRFLPAWCW